MSNELLFCLKKSVYVKKKEFRLSEICEVYGADDTSKVSDYSIHIDNVANTVTAFEVAKKLSEFYPKFSITNVGAEECTVFLRNKPQKKVMLLIKTVILCAIMFFGGAITIMTFHEDTNMRKVHSGIYEFFTGEQEESVPVVSVPYSFGIAIGFAMLYGLFKKKKSQPSLLDLNIYEHENTLKNYLAESNKQDDK